MTQPRSTDLSLPVTEEELHLGRRVVEGDSALRLRKSVVHEPAEVEGDFARETVRVERVRVDRVVDSAPPVRQEGDVTVVPVVEERLVLRKELVLVEELRLVRERVLHHETAAAELRKERVTVERLDPASGQWMPEPGT